MNFQLVQSLKRNFIKHKIISINSKIEWSIRMYQTKGSTTEDSLKTSLAELDDLMKIILKNSSVQTDKKPPFLTENGKKIVQEIGDLITFIIKGIILSGQFMFNALPSVVQIFSNKDYLNMIKKQKLTTH